MGKISPQRDKLIKATHKLFVILPHFSEVEIRKDPGIIPEYLNKFGYQTFVFCKNPPEKTGLKTKILKLDFRNILRYLKKEENARNVLLFYFVPYNIKFVLFFLFAKLYNPRTFIIIKTDGVPIYEKWSFWEKYARGIEAKLLYPLLLDLIITEAPEYKTYLSKMFGWESLKDKITVLPNGVEIENYNLKKRKNVYKSVFYAGTLSVPKGTHLLLQAFTRLKDQYPDWRLILMGDPLPEFEPQLKKYKRILGKRLELKGFLTGKKLYQEFVDGDIYVCPSYTWKESFNLAMAEAMASKNAVIATDKKLEGAWYVLDYGKAGFLFKKGNVDHLVESLSLLMGNDRLREQMGRAAYKRATEFFDWKKIIKRLDFLIKENMESFTDVTEAK